MHCGFALQVVTQQQMLIEIFAKYVQERQRIVIVYNNLKGVKCKAGVR